MGKLAPTALFTYAQRRGTQSLRSPYSDKVRLWMNKQSATWDKSARVWVMGDDIAEECKQWLRSEGYEIVEQGAVSPASKELFFDSRLHPYQKRDVTLALKHGYWMLAYSMGLGKTATALHIIGNWGGKSHLIVCPASVREVWQDQIDEWWPDHPPVAVVTSGKDPIPHEHVVITSYELLHHFTSLSVDGWSSIVVDESHFIKHANTKRGHHLETLSRQSPDAMRLCLTGTPIADKPADLHAQLQWLTPGRWGNWWCFVHKYCHVDHTKWGKKVYGARNQDRLRQRLASVSSRVTWDEVKHLQPKVSSQTHRVDTRIKGVQELLASRDGRAIVFTFRRADAREISKVLQYNHSVYCVTGEDSPVQRHAELKYACRLPNAVLVATMDSVGTGIDCLTAFPYVVFAGLSYKPQTLLQAIGRVCRLTQKEPVQLHFVVERGSQEELTACIVAKKLLVNRSVIDADLAQDRLESLLTTKMSDEEFQVALQEELSESFAGTDEYL